MRALRVPCFVLLVLLALSLANSVAMERRCARWDEALDAAQQAAFREQWTETEALLDTVQEEMSSCAVWLHVTASHSTADEAERLLEQARLMCRLQEGPHVHEALSELRVLLGHAAENERLTLGNIL